MMAADLATKFYRGLVATVNSHLWRNGSVDGVIPLLDDSNTFLLTHGGKVVWTGQNETCHHLACPALDNFYCRCGSCNSSFWASYTNLFCGDLIEKIDLEPDLPESDNLSDVTTHSDPLPVNLSSDQTSDSISFQDLKLGDKSISDVTNEFAHLSGRSCNSSTNSTSNYTTPQSNSSCQPVVNDSSSDNAAEIPLPGLSLIHI